jgi:hypothetical protein
MVEGQPAHFIETRFRSRRPKAQLLPVRAHQTACLHCRTAPLGSGRPRPLLQQRYREPRLRERVGGDSSRFAIITA